jgi:hypothetical protein
MESEEQKIINQNRLKNLLFYIMIITVIGLSIYLIIWTKTQSFQYAKDPFGFAMREFELKNNAVASCSGYVFNSKGSEPFIITDKGMQLGVSQVTVNVSGGRIS